MISDKSKLNQLNSELGSTWERIMEIISKEQNRSIMVFNDDKWSESASAMCEQFDGRVTYIRRQLKKIADQIKKSKKNV